MKKSPGLLEVHAAVLLFGTAGLFGKWLDLSPFIIVLGRVFFASVSLGLFLRFSGKTSAFRPDREWPYYILLGFILAVHWVTFFQSIQVSSVSVGLLSFAAYPVFTIFLEPLFFREKWIPANIGIAFICIAGVFFIIPRFDIENTVFAGVLWGVLSGFLFSLLTIFNRKLSLQHSSLIIAFRQNLFATIFLLPVYAVLRPRLDWSRIGLLILLGVICTAVSHSLFIKGMRHVKAQVASMVHSLEPVYGIILAFLFLNEIPAARTLAGGILVLSGQALIIYRFVKRKS